jgi:hypothetical protein
MGCAKSKVNFIGSSFEGEDFSLPSLSSCSGLSLSDDALCSPVRSCAIAAAFARTASRSFFFSSSSNLYFARFSGSNRSSFLPPFFFFALRAFLASFSFFFTAFLNSFVGSEYPR